MKTTYLKLELLTPVHIGSGEILDPLNYVMKQDGDSTVMHHVDLDAWLEGYSDQKELNQILEANHIPAMRKYIAEHLDTDLYTRSRTQVLSDSIWKEYQKNMVQLDSRHQLQVAAAQKNARNGALLVPGSSVKGAIRTAVIDYLDDAANLNLRQYADEWGSRDYDKALEKVLGRIDDNAFSGLKIGDFEAPVNQAHLVTAKEVPLKRDKNPTPKNNCETTWSFISQGQECSLYTTLRTGRPGKGDAPLYIQGKPWSWEALCEKVNAYSLQRIQDEIDKFYTSNPKFRDAQPTVKQIEAYIKNSSSNQMILRLGHYSQVEYVTVTHNKPRTPKGKPHGTTRTLADGRWPFGWIAISLCSEEEYKNYWDNKLQHDAQILEEQEGRRRAIEKKIEQVQAEKLRQKQERIRQEEEEAAHPWRALVRQIESSVTDWGTLKQHVLENQELQPYQQETEVVKAVETLAITVRDNHRKNWDAERDAAIAQWLEPGGVQWQALPDEEESKQAQLTPEEQEQISLIEGISDWGQYQRIKPDLDALSLVALRTLRDKLQALGFNQKGKKANKKKKAAYDEVHKLIKQRK